MIPLLRRHPRLLFFALGLIVTLTAVLFGMNWLAMFRFLLQDPTLTYETRPPWLRGLALVFAYLPWILLAVVIAARLKYGRAVRPLAFALGAATPYVVIMALLFVGPVVSDHWHRRDFDPAAWRANELSVSIFWPTRLVMVDDLLASRILVGLSRSEVEQLLGPRDATTKWWDWDLVYWLGPERGLFGIDSEWLAIRFDDQELVSEARIVRD